ncbi:right-handed parallel beta-helix repeat-containing protein [Filimonas effusa]|uniref:Right-handed parallel beta-helix repeat-containing protein n=1 Tax=Filimonas effusa TaxID=2508721 RepID=A0A4Q1D9N0_9BACT|nr:right-handed parallel beta-helix repeat-containing protein [Filimonas effusa]RXK86061.1 right-handed parallel beta-helix repeat-containing protein [Filimonas effusa]
MKSFLRIAFVATAFAGCAKNNDPVPSVDDPSLQAVTTSAVVVAAVNTTVTTESALKAAIAAANPGDIITISGTIKLTSTLQLLRSGTASAKINFTGGTLDCSGISSGWGVKCNGSYWNITNMVIKNGPDCGLVFQTGGYNYVYNVTTSGNHDSGLQIYNGSHHNNVSYCNSYDNYDSQNGGENADGFACKLSAGAGNLFDHCTATHNSDDGWDLYGQPESVKITNCTAANNGYGSNGDGNGFKLGSAGQNVPHTVTNCTANNNKAWGYDGNGNTGHITTTGSGGSGNGSGLFTRIY